MYSGYYLFEGYGWHGHATGVPGPVGLGIRAEEIVASLVELDLDLS